MRTFEKLLQAPCSVYQEALAQRRTTAVEMKTAPVLRVATRLCLHLVPKRARISTLTNLLPVRAHPPGPLTATGVVRASTVPRHPPAQRKVSVVIIVGSLGTFGPEFARRSCEHSVGDRIQPRRHSRQGNSNS